MSHALDEHYSETAKNNHLLPNRGFQARMAATQSGRTRVGHLAPLLGQRAGVLRS